MQEAQKLHAEVVWQIDRLAVELAEAQRDVAQLTAQARSSGSARTVGDVDTDMEALENQRTALEREKDTAMRKLERLRWGYSLECLTSGGRCRNLRLICCKAHNPVHC